jgi:hypothetical protein
VEEWRAFLRDSYWELSLKTGFLPNHKVPAFTCPFADFFKEFNDRPLTVDIINTTNPDAFALREAERKFIRDKLRNVFDPFDFSNPNVFSKPCLE